MGSRRLGQWRLLSDIDRRLIARVGAALAEFRNELADKHLNQAQRLQCSKNGTLADRITGVENKVDIEALMG